MQLIIYGAKALALGIYTAIRELYPQYGIQAFVVSSMQDNPATLAGLPVLPIAGFAAGITEGQKGDIHIIVGTPEDIHPEIMSTLIRYGFVHYTCMDSRRESRLMEQYYEKRHIFASVHELPAGKEKARLEVYIAKSYKDRHLQSAAAFPEWAAALQVGAQLTDVRVAAYTDHTGEHISAKNGNYCELTALYWIWKNRLSASADASGRGAYHGLFHYRRILDITEMDLYRLDEDKVDAILQFPTIHAPDISEHHARYLREADWEAMLTALRELQPAYAQAFPKILAQPYFYNYNLIIARREVLAAYCEWLFPILERTEELSSPKGSERADRYIGYLGENLMTLYFLYNKDKLKIFHTGRLMLT